MNVLGISCFYHDAAACLVIDGSVVSAAQEERFSRKKHDKSFPINSIAYCLSEAGIRLSEVDAVAYYEDPLIKFNRRSNLGLDKKKYINDVAKVFLIPEALKAEFCDDFKAEFYCVKHHLSHAASAFLPSPFEDAAILTIDGVGEWQTTTISHGRRNAPIDLKVEFEIPQSLGLFYSAITSFCGFKVNSGEYKLMGLAPYGTPKYVDLIEKYVLSNRETGTFCLNEKIINVSTDSKSLISDELSRIFGVEKRCADDGEPTQIYCDIAASAQLVFEKSILNLVASASKIVDSNNLVLAGGVALNCVANSKIRLKKYFENIWVQPAAGDAGGSMGAALYVSDLLSRKFNEKRSAVCGGLNNFFLGPSFRSADVSEYFNFVGVSYSQFGSKRELAAKVAELLSLGDIVALFEGRMEFGPRALGNRSILANPLLPSVQKDLNLRTKFRESFRPFAPIVLEEKVAEIFKFQYKDPYMLFINWVKDYVPVNRDETSSMHQKLKDVAQAAKYPAITHVDGSARVQTVGNDNRMIRYILERFNELTGAPLLVNTSFNIKNEPIVCSPEDALRCFSHAGIDYLTIENILISKNDIPPGLFDNAWISEMEAD